MADNICISASLRLFIKKSVYFRFICTVLSSMTKLSEICLVWQAQKNVKIIALKQIFSK